MWWGWKYDSVSPRNILFECSSKIPTLGGDIFPKSGKVVGSGWILRPLIPQICQNSDSTSLLLFIMNWEKVLLYHHTRTGPLYMLYPNLIRTRNYCPISLINVDLKWLTKILVTRMNSFLSKYIHPDQAGFVPNRQTTDQTRRIIDIISALNSGWDGRGQRGALLVSLDLHKAFDSLSWDYLFFILKKYEFGLKIFWLHLKYYTALPQQTL